MDSASDAWAAVRQVHQTLTTLGLAVHPDKTFTRAKVEKALRLSRVSPHAAGALGHPGDLAAVLRPSAAALRGQRGSPKASPDLVRTFSAGRSGPVRDQTGLWPVIVTSWVLPLVPPFPSETE